jgi:hypothetical protein
MGDNHNNYFLIKKAPWTGEVRYGIPDYEWK